MVNGRMDKLGGKSAMVGGCGAGLFLNVLAADSVLEAVFCCSEAVFCRSRSRLQLWPKMGQCLRQDWADKSGGG